MAEKRKDVFEEDAWLRKIGELTQSFLEGHLETGEFGGGGGLVGGESGVLGGIWTVSRWMRGGGIWWHGGGEEKGKKKVAAGTGKKR